MNFGTTLAIRGTLVAIAIEDRMHVETRGRTALSTGLRDPAFLSSEPDRVPLGSSRPGGRAAHRLEVRTYGARRRQRGRGRMHSVNGGTWNYANNSQCD